MPTYQRADDSVEELANQILHRFESHHPLLNAEVKFDFIFAFPTLDDEGMATGDAIKHHGQKALGLCRIVNLKDRVMGRGDVEILIDSPWWDDASDEERAALLDHELHHAEVKTRDGAILYDDAHRPLIKLRKHDVEIGWFDVVALRNGPHSIERKQAKQMFDGSGQLYWPEVAGEPDAKMVQYLSDKHGEASIKASVRSFVNAIKKSGTSVTISAPGMEPVTIGKKAA